MTITRLLKMFAPNRQTVVANHQERTATAPPRPTYSNRVPRLTAALVLVSSGLGISTAALPTIALAQNVSENAASSQTPATGQTADEPRPAGRVELEKLQWLLGQWSTPSDAAIPAQATGQWSADGQFLLLDYEVSPPGFPTIRSSERIAWDPAAKAYRSWTFRGDGGFGQASWVPRENGWMIRYGGTHGDGRQFSSTLMLAQGPNNRLQLSAIERWVGDEQFPDLVLELQQQDLAAAPAGQVEGPLWVLTKLPSGPVRAKTPPTLLLQNQEVNAFGGINRIGGAYTINGQNLRLRNLVSTLMGGAAAESELEQEFSANLEKVTQFSFEGKTLILAGTDGPLAWFEAQATEPAPVDFQTVLSVTWELIELNGQTVEVTPPPTLQFVDGNVSGFGGVNQMGGTYNQTDRSLTFGPLRATRRAGPPDAMQLEARFTQTLARVDRFDVRDGALLLLSGNEVVAKLQQQP